MSYLSSLTQARKFSHKAPFHARSAHGQQGYLWFAAIHLAALVLALMAITH